MARHPVVSTKEWEVEGTSKARHPSITAGPHHSSKGMVHHRCRIKVPPLEHLSPMATRVHQGPMAVPNPMETSSLMEDLRPSRSALLIH